MSQAARTQSHPQPKSLADRVREANRDLDRAQMPRDIADRMLGDAAAHRSDAGFEEGWASAMAFAKMALLENGEPLESFFKRHGRVSYTPRITPAQERQDMSPDDPATCLPLARIGQQPKFFKGNEINNRPISAAEFNAPAAPVVPTDHAVAPRRSWFARFSAWIRR